MSDTYSEQEVNELKQAYDAALSRQKQHYDSQESSFSAEEDDNLIKENA